MNVCIIFINSLKIQRTEVISWSWKNNPCHCTSPPTSSRHFTYWKTLWHATYRKFWLILILYWYFGVKLETNFQQLNFFWCINIWILQFYQAMFLTYMHTVLCRSQAIPLFFIFSYKNAKRVQRFLETCRHKWKNRVCTILTSSKVNVWYNHLMTA